MDTSHLSLLIVLIFITSILYSSIGHGGASGYLAIMALFSLTPEVIKPTALMLNILVSGIAAISYYRTGGFSWPVFWPFAITSIPCAFAGSTISLPGNTYKLILGIIILFAAFRLWGQKKFVYLKPVPPSLYLKFLAGAVIGFLSGLIGVGGGIFLSPLLLITGWADAKKTAGVSAAFILVNSISGITGHLASMKVLPEEVWFLAAAAALGGTIGSQLGSKRFAPVTLRRILATVLVIAGLKLVV